MQKTVHPKAIAFQDLANTIRRAHGLQARLLLDRTEPIYNSTRSQIKALLSSTSSSQTKVVLTGLPRSGTGYVQRILASHPDSFVKGEVFDPAKHRYNNYVRKAEELAAKRHQPLFCLKFLLFQSPSYLEDLMQLAEKGWKILGTFRQDVAAQALSYYLATALDTFHSDSPSTPQGTITVQIPLLKETLSLFQEAHLQLQQDYGTLGAALQVVHFEKDILVPHRSIANIAHFLKLNESHLAEGESPTFPDKWKLMSNADNVQEWASQHSL